MQYYIKKGAGGIIAMAMKMKDRYKHFLEQYELEDIEILSLEGRESLKKIEIYKILACLMNETSNLDDMNSLVDSKVKTWRKYIDYFPKVFNVKLYAELSQEIPLIKALICIGFILVLEDQVYFSTRMNNQRRPKYINRIKKTINKEDKKENKIGKFEELLSYDEKNEFITNLGEIFSIYDWGKFGIKGNLKLYDEKGEFIEYLEDCFSTDDNEEESGYEQDKRKTSKVDKELYISDLKQFKKNQIKFKMLSEIDPYELKVFSFASDLRMRTALEELRRRFICDTQEAFKINGEVFLKGLTNEIAQKSTRLFEMNKSGYSSDDLSDELISIFDGYVEKEFEAFKQKWISETKDFNFDPDTLI